MRRRIGEGGENGILFILSPSISKYESRNEKKIIYITHLKISLGRNPTEFNRFSSKLRVIERGFGI